MWFILVIHFILFCHHSLNRLGTLGLKCIETILHSQPKEAIRSILQRQRQRRSEGERKGREREGGRERCPGVNWKIHCQVFLCDKWWEITNSLKYCFYLLLWISKYKAHILLKAQMSAQKDGLLFIRKDVWATSRGTTDRHTQSKISVKIRDHIAPKRAWGTLTVKDVVYIILSGTRKKFQFPHMANLQCEQGTFCRWSAHNGSEDRKFRKGKESKKHLFFEKLMFCYPQ